MLKPLISSPLAPNQHLRPATEEQQEKGAKLPPSALCHDPRSYTVAGQAAKGPGSAVIAHEEGICDGRRGGGRLAGH